MKHYAIISLIACSTAISACGGSGGSSNGQAGAASQSTPQVSNPTQPDPQPATQSLTFKEQAASRGLGFSSDFSADYMQMPRHFAGGAASGDIDGDGDIDLVVVRGDTQANLLFINDGGIFTERAMPALALPNGGTSNYKLSGPTLADIDGDKDLDLFIGGADGHPSLIFSNDGSGIFTNVTTGSGLDTATSKNTISAAFGDYDKDGDLDLALAHWGTPRDRNAPGETETLWRNDSDANDIKFTAVSAPAGISATLIPGLQGVLGLDTDYTFAPNFADINDDGYPDLLSVSDFGGSKVYMNNKDGTFADVTDTTQITDSNGMGAAVGDYDNDGDLDWFVSSINGNRLYNNMNSTLIGVSETAGIERGGWGWGSCFADFDLDGHLDIYQTNGWPDSLDDRTHLWMSNGQGAFTDQAEETGIDDNQQGRGIVCADFNGDRDIDVLLLLSNTSPAALLWENTLPSNNSVSVTLNGPSPNTHAIGSRVYVTTDETTQMRDVAIGSNFTSHNPTEQIFGLGSSELIDELKIVWPDGTQITRSDIAANQDLTFTHPDY